MGVHINAAVIGDGIIQMTMPLPAYATYWNNVLGLNESYLTDLNTRADNCGFTTYIEEHLVYPPPQGPIPEFEFPFQDDEFPEDYCYIWLPLREAAELINPCFNIYHIVDTFPWPL